MKNIFLTVITLFCLSPLWVSAQKKPNVIIIYTDDQATLDVNVLGAKDLVSPHMDQLLLSGTTFT
ncbi:MAG: hypothetical protein ACPIB5_03935, partial [Flavobacteriaceae bacterium]